MADVKRTRFYAESDGLTIDRKTGEYREQTVRVTGRFKTKEAAEKSIRRHYKDFLPKDTRLGMREYVMSEDDFYRQAKEVEPDSEKNTKNNK
ncbi:MAG: hypothetical protein [Bacteriophage sp.]|nr:MAG: hypothetical protein [Bacteriophage sp.]